MATSKKNFSNSLPMSDDETVIIDYLRKQLSEALQTYKNCRNTPFLSRQNLSSKLNHSEELAKTSLLTFIRLVLHAKAIKPELDFTELSLLATQFPTGILKELSELYKDPVSKEFIESVIHAYYTSCKKGKQNGKTENA